MDYEFTDRAGKSMDRFREMLTFVWVIDTGSFSAAARHLNVGQPAVSKTISSLEKRLQVKLIVRSAHVLAPTEAGLHFYEHARLAIKEAEVAENSAMGAQAEMSGRLRVSAAPTFARLHIVSHLHRFLAAHPNIKVDVILDDRLINVISEKIDLSLRLGTAPSPSAVARRLAIGPRAVIVTPTYIARFGEPREPAELNEREGIVYTQMPTEWSFNRGEDKQVVVMNGRVRVSGAEGQRAAVLAHMGFAIASEWMFAPELGCGTVKRVLLDWELPTIDLWGVFPAGRLAPLKARVFAGFVEATMAETKATYSAEA